MTKNKEERTKFIKKIIFWSVLAGGVIALFVPMLTTDSINVLAADSLVDPCSIGPCLSDIEKTSQGFQGNADIIFGIVNVFIYVGGAISVGVMAWGGGQIALGKDKEGRSTIKYGAIALALMISVYVVISIVVGITSKFQTSVSAGGGTSGGTSSAKELACQQQAESSCSSHCTGTSHSSLCETCVQNAYNTCLSQP